MPMLANILQQNDQEKTRDLHREKKRTLRTVSLVRSAEEYPSALKLCNKNTLDLSQPPKLAERKVPYRRVKEDNIRLPKPYSGNKQNCKKGWHGSLFDQDQSIESLDDLNVQGTKKPKRKNTHIKRSMNEWETVYNST